MYQVGNETYFSPLFGDEEDRFKAPNHLNRKLIKNQSRQDVNIRSLESARDFFGYKLSEFSKPEIEEVFIKATRKVKFVFFEVDNKTDFFTNQGTWGHNQIES